MTIKSKSTKIAILIILAALPALFPFGGRDDYIVSHIPSFIDTRDGTFMTWILLFALIWITIIWCLYGYLAARWFGKSIIIFLICNAPVIVNAVSEIVYYIVLGFSSTDYPNIAYWIGSHIDKVNPLQHIFGVGPVIMTVTISVLYFFFLFWAAYHKGLEK